ncbi:MAG: hypothetical protein RIQ59_730 [Bacteroidota bacterium]|jgi:thiol-disulfide isomerase/thioredoxin
MKKTILFTFLIAISFTYSQTGKMFLKDSKASLENEIAFVYQPAQGVIVPDNSMVKLVFKNDKNYLQKRVVLTKKGTNYEFIYKFPSPTIKVFIATVLDGKNTIDNNYRKGYVVYLNATSKTELEQAKLEELQIANFANYVIKLEITPLSIISKYEALFKANPKLKSGTVYKDYVYAKFFQDKEKYGSEMLSLAQKNEKSANENDLMDAYDSYSIMKMEDKTDTLKERILATYPQGDLAKRYFFKDLYEKEDRDAEFIKSTYEAYKIRFNDNGTEINDRMNNELIWYYLKKQDITNIEKCEALLKDKLRAANRYNQIAWELSGQDLTTPATNIDFAASLSNKALAIAKEKLIASENDELEQGQYNTFADTYALVLYKQNKYKEAFEYEDEVRKLDGLDTGGKERYAGFAEQYKGPEFAKTYIEQELKKGVDSKLMLSQLQNIYTKLNLPEEQFEQLKAKAITTSGKKRDEEIINEFGTNVAPNFSLKNLEGKTVQLSDFRGKMVVLDFWATWCGPCKASFPKMQEIVTKYKDKEVVFLFVDTFEQTKPDQTLKKVSQFIEDKKYNFNVILDTKETLAEDYKVTFIPKKFVIDTKGNLIAINIQEEDLIILLNDRLN